MTTYLCSSCCYPIIASPDDVWTLLYSKYGRAIILDGVEHELLDLLELKPFLGFRSYDYNSNLNYRIINTPSTFGTIQVGFSKLSADFLWQEIYYKPIRDHEKSNWLEVVKGILKELKK